MSVKILLPFVDSDLPSNDLVVSDTDSCPGSQ